MVSPIRLSTTPSIGKRLKKWLRRGVNETAPEFGADGHQPIGLALTQDTVFRSFSPADFCQTASWQSLRQILKGNGGSFGLYGPRGSGKSWLMLMAVEEANRKGGLGLWYPCPSKYSAMDFLSTLSDNLANAVERRFARSRAVVSGLRRIGIFLAAIVGVLLLLALILYAVRGLVADHGTTGRFPGAAAIFPNWIWILIGVIAFLALIASSAGIVYNAAAKGSLLRAATSLRERIRFSELLKLSADAGVKGGKGLMGSLSASRERSLSERPTSVASLVFDFRNLAEQIVSTLKKPLVICIDELDKIEDTVEVRSLLREIKGIFELDGTHFLVSISEEAAVSLQIGTLLNGGRNELNSSFYSVIELPPLDSEEADQLLRSRKFGHSARLARALCLLAGGNRRELVRMAGSCAAHARRRSLPLDERTIIGLLAEESFALLQEITRELPEVASATDGEDVKYRAWMALPRDGFDSPEKFARLGSAAIREYWEPLWANDSWANVRESWRRLLLRIFTAAKVLPPANNQDVACLLDDDGAVNSLRDILMMATHDSGVARLMLSTRFGSDLSERYHSSSPPASR